MVLLFVSYFVSLRIDSDSDARPSQNQNWSDLEQEFFHQYTTDVLSEQHSAAYSHSLMVHHISSPDKEPQSDEKLPDDLTRDYSGLTVNDLKARCRERQLPVSGVKSALLERIIKDNEDQIAQLLKERRFGRTLIPGPIVFATSPLTTKHLRDLISEYVKASGGIATSRDVGRYLAANRGSAHALAQSSAKKLTALQELKDSYGNLAIFITQQSDLFVARDDESDLPAFFIELKSR